MERLLTEKEVADLLGLKNPKTLNVWRCTKRYPELKWIKIGQRVRYAKADVDAFIASRKQGG